MGFPFETTRIFSSHTVAPTVSGGLTGVTELVGI